ncbi:MAG: MAPEG family protein [Pseudomonadota bacterium]
MTPELEALFAATAILLIVLAVQGALTPVKQGLKWGLGPRDEPRDLSVLQGRAARVVANHMEAMALFTPLALIVHLGDLSSGLTAAGAWIFVAARALFALVYLMGVPVVRSLVWGVGVAGLLMVATPIVSAI